jgi:hypothetical protein
MTNVAERFWSKVNKNGSISIKNPELGPCWESSYCKTYNGYARFKIGQKNFRANRLSWEWANNRHPGKLKVLHHCDNRICVRPSHLNTGLEKELFLEYLRAKPGKT